MRIDARDRGDVVKGRWLVLVGGLARAQDAVQVSSHRSYQAALRRCSMQKAYGDDAYVTHSSVHEAALRGGTEAVQALAGKEIA
jgi:hypothetical protein